MAIIATAGKQYPPHPADQFPGVCIDVIDLGMVDVHYQGQPPKKQHKIVIRWWCGQYGVDDDGSQIPPKKIPLFAGRRFTNSLAPSSNLLPFLEGWRGRKFTSQELKGFDLEGLIGAPALLEIQHSEKNGRTYADVVNCMRLPKGMTAPAPLEGYIRSKDRTDEDAPETGREPGADDDDDLPF